MSMPACGWAVRRAMELNLPTLARATLFVLAETRGVTGKLCPSLPYLCARTGLSDNSQRKWLRVLREAGAVDWIASAGNATHYRLIGFEPPQDVKGSNGSTPSKRAHTPAGHEGVTPARREGVRRSDPLKLEGLPPHHATSTPARLAGEPLEPREPRAREPAREGVSDFSRVEESKPEPAQPEPEREPTPAEIEAQRREHAAAMAELPPEMAAAIGGLGAALSGRAYEPGRPPLRSPADQEAALAARRPRPAYVTGDALLMLRRLSGIPSPPPALRRAAE